MARYSRLLVSCTVTLLALALLGCGGSSAPAPPDPGAPQAPAARSPRTPLTPQQRAQLQQKAARVLPPQAIAALQQIGMPVLPPNPAASGKDVSVFLPYALGAAQEYTVGDAGYIGNSPDVFFSPFNVTLTPTGSSFPGNFSYMLYRVDDIAGQLPGLLTLDLASTAGQDIGVAAYNWGYGSLGRWEPLYYGSAENPLPIAMPLPPGGSWLNGGEDMAFVIFVLNPSSVVVNAITVDEAPANNWPLVDLQANPSGGAAPLSVALDGSASQDVDGTIVQYEFDPLGDGNFVDNGANPVYNFEYVDPGAYDAQLRATDDDGDSSTWQTTVIVSDGSYDEVEDNDAPLFANPLPALPFGGFYGNCGPEGGYDGDVRDIFTFDASTGDEVSFMLRYSNSGGTDFTVSLENSAGNTLASSFGYPPQPLNYTFGPLDFGPFYIRIEAPAGGSDYLLTGTDLAYDEVEDNDGPASAQYLGDLVSAHEVTDFLASLGDNPPAYEGYDGDSDDWYTFDTLANAQFDLTATYNDDGGNNNIGVTLFDGNLQELASSATGSGQEVLTFTFDGSQPTPYFLQFHSSAGGADYEFDATITITNPGFSEQENNDTEATANDFGAFPVAGFTGNIGPGGNYDGDFDDYFSFDLNPGEMAQLTITPDDQFAFLSATVSDSGGTFRVVGGAEYAPGSVTVYVVARTNDVGPYVLHLNNSGTATDYTIDGDLLTDYMELENNDDEASANALPDFFQFFSGNLGPGGYDGDTEDNFSFAAQQGTSPSFTVYFDETSGVLPVLTIRDSEGDVLSDSFEDGPGQWVVYLPSLLDSGDVAPYYLEVQMTGGTTNYWLSRSDMMP